MYLKSIEIQGFKSFPDKTLLNFSNGITAIVGPNGSGKSNIVDAIRWVLGEQSTKTLRGGKMEDVIFGGTAKRTPQGFCQVTLTLDNSDGKIDTEFSEVSVTRRYYRSGESEFFINRKSVRLRDIHEMFMDTGLGRDGYSIIGQGRIDEILSVKSADRREIFEEASGITKFRYRREESERRLNAAEENLVRVRDIITELEAQVEPLRVQAEKAKDFLIYRDELRLLEVSVWMDSLSRLKDNVQRAQIDYDNAVRALSAKKREVEEIYTLSANITEEMHEKDIASERQREQLRELEVQEADIRSSIAVNNTNLKNNEDNILSKARELELHGQREQSFEAQRADRLDKIAIADNEVQLIEAESVRLKRELLEIAQQSGDAAGRLSAITAEVQLKRSELQQTSIRQGAILSARGEIETRREALSSELEQSHEGIELERARAESIEQQIVENTEKRQSAENMLRGFELRCESRRAKAERLRESTEALSRELNAKRDRYTLLKALEREFEGFSHSVKKVMSAAQGRELRGIHGPLSTLIKTQDEYAVAIEIALGAAMQNIITDDEASAKQAIEYLKRRDFGRATFLPLTAVKQRGGIDRNLSGEKGFCGMGAALVQCEQKYERIIVSQLGSTAVCDNMDSAIALAKKHSYSFRIVTLDGQLINPSGAMTGGSLNKNVGMLSRANEIDRLNGELSELEQKSLKIDGELSEAKRELSAAEYDVRVSLDQQRLAQDALLGLEGQKSQHEALVGALEKRNRELLAELEGHSIRIAENDRAQKQAQDEIDHCLSETEQWEEKLRQLGGEAEQHEAVKNELSDKMADCRSRMAALSATREGHVSALSELEIMIAALSGDKLQKTDEIDVIRTRNEEIRAQIAAQEQGCAAITKNTDNLREQIKNINNEKINLEGQRAKCERDLKDRNDDVVNMERECGRLENKKTQLEMEESSILGKMWDGYELTRISAALIAVSIGELQSPLKRINELKSEIKKLGSVNVDAIDEYARVNERYEFLSTQRNDLEKAKSELLNIIADLTKNMESIFGEQFARINVEFGKTFIDIFGGGSAELRLEDPNDILNCGIEIRVELPGKSMRAISLLSGGEKALVAIVLYFAIIKVRPTPFCVLDEIEAALDDINVLRYIGYMRTLIGDTQFIVITHRRGTMEGADILYGVTMQEQGISKLLALNISEVEEKIKLKPN